MLLLEEAMIFELEENIVTKFLSDLGYYILFLSCT